MFDSLIKFSLYRIQSDQLNSTITWSSSDTRHQLTEYAEGVTIATLDKQSEYYCAGIGNHEYLVCGINQFNLNSDRRDTRKVPIESKEYLTLELGEIIPRDM